MTISGSGDATVQVKDKLDVHLTGEGDVNYTGTPQISQSISGSGQIRQVTNP